MANKCDRKNRKILITFGKKGLWFTDKIITKIKNYNVKMPYNDDIFNINEFWEINSTNKCDWWNGTEAFYEQKKDINLALRNKQEIIILAERLYGFCAGFICNFLIMAKQKNKKVTLITARNAINDTCFLEYLSDKTEIINILDLPKFKESLASRLSLSGLETCMNTLYLEQVKEKTL